MKTPAKTTTKSPSQAGGKKSSNMPSRTGSISRPGKPGNDPDMTPNKEVTKRPVAKP
jgi:hypothetical protein